MRVWSTFNPAAPGTPVGYDSYTWAARPAAANYTGRVIRITDVGPAAGALFISDGTYWTPLGGHLVLAAGAELGLSTTSTSDVQLAGWSLVIPAGLFRKPGSYLRGIVRCRRTGTLGAGSNSGMKVGWGAAGASSIMGRNTGLTSSVSAFSSHGVLSRVSDSQVRSAHVNISDIPGVNNPSALVALDATVDQTIAAFGRVNNPPGADETLWVDEIILELLTP